MIQTILNKIKDKLGTLTDIVAVYDYPVITSEGYPYAFITWDGNESEVLTNYEDSVIMNYTITLVQEKMEELKGRQNAEITAMNRAWEIEELFRKNNDLDTTGVLRVLPVSTIKKYNNDATRIILEIKLKIQVVVSITT